MRTINGRTDHVVVVGAGLSGLSAALHLLGAGRSVTVLERGNEVGGRMGREVVDGFSVDTGPTVLTMPELFDEAMGAVGTSLGEHVTLHRLDPAYRARFADGSHLDVHTDAEAMETELREHTDAATAAGYRKLRQWFTDLYDAEIDRFIGSSFDSPLDLVRSRAAAADVLRLVRLGGFGRLGHKVASLLPDERAQRLFSFQALYAGLPPNSALGAYGVIPYMDTVAGVYFPEGGMHAVARAMADAATGAGASVELGTEVTRLDRSGPSGRVAAVHTADGRRIPCDVVVLTGDLPLTDALIGHPHRRRVGTRWSPSCVVMHGGVPTEVAAGWPEPAHHTIDFGAAWKTTFDEIIAGGRKGRGRLMSDPSLLVTRPTHTDPSLAPDGQELCYVLAPCPNLESAPLDWAAIGPAYTQELLGVMETRGWTGIAEHFRPLDVVTPAGWAAQGMAAGTPFSAAHTLAQTGPFRRGNLVPGVDNAVLAGCGTTPGVGVPTVLISGRLAAQRITGV
ncbi:MAG: phytoene desaturase family protein [Mycobacteriaceae bacterium]